MNAVFAIIIVVSLIYLLFTDPTAMLPALTGGTLNALTSIVTLFCIYALWLSLSRLAEKSGLTKPITRGLKPLVKRLFKTEDKEAIENISMNLTCNLLGIGGAATPYGLKAMSRLDKSGNDFAQKLLFILNASSVQLIPITGISLRSAGGSSTPFDIILPCLLCTLFCSVLSTSLYLAGHKLWHI